MNLKEVEYALEDLEDLLDWVNKDCSIAGFLDLVASANTIRIALKKQIPKKLSRWDEITYKCPTCGKSYWTHRYIGSYCSKCGQKIVRS